MGRRQAEDAVKKMRGKLMFAKAVALRALLTVKHAHVGQCTNLIHKVANVCHEEWTATGCVYTLDLSTLQVAMMKPTNGDYSVTFIDEDGQAPPSAADSAMNSSQRSKQKKRDKKKKKNKDRQQAQAQSQTNENKKKKKKGKGK